MGQPKHRKLEFKKCAFDPKTKTNIEKVPNTMESKLLLESKLLIRMREHNGVESAKWMNEWTQSTATAKQQHQRNSQQQYQWQQQTLTIIFIETWAIG